MARGRRIPSSGLGAARGCLLVAEPSVAEDGTPMAAGASAFRQTGRGWEMARVLDFSCSPETWLDLCGTFCGLLLA